MQELREEKLTGRHSLPSWRRYAVDVAFAAWKMLCDRSWLRWGPDFVIHFRNQIAPFELTAGLY